MKEMFESHRGGRFKSSGLRIGQNRSITPMPVCGSMDQLPDNGILMEPPRRLEAVWWCLVKVTGSKQVTDACWKEAWLYLVQSVARCYPAQNNIKEHQNVWISGIGVMEAIWRSVTSPAFILCLDDKGNDFLQQLNPVAALAAINIGNLVSGRLILVIYHVKLRWEAFRRCVMLWCLFSRL